MKQLIITIILVALLLAAIFFFNSRPQRPQPTPEPTPIPAPVDIPVTWESLDTGYGPLPDKYALVVQADPAKVDGGWRLFRNNFGEYRVTYSVDEWMVALTDKEYVKLDPIDSKIINWGGHVLNATHTPWWLYYNTRTGEVQIVYGTDLRDATQPDQSGPSNCPTGNCPVGATDRTVGPENRGRSGGWNLLRTPVVRLH